jgi:thioredoxin-related protein
MKPLLLISFSFFMLCAFTFQHPVLPLGADIPKADIKMKSTDGAIISLQEAKTANGLLVMFTCNTCPYVIKNQGRTKQICSLARDKGMGVILLNSNEVNRPSNGETYKDMQVYAKEQDYKWPYVMDSDNLLADAFGATRTPECFLFNANGILVYHGAIDDSPADISQVNRHHLQEAIAEMTGGKNITVKESRSIGCSIRRKG